MRNRSLYQRLRTLFSAALAVATLMVAHAAGAQSHLEMSQVYGGGGNSMATLRYDYVELFNPTGSDIDLSSYTIQYASAAGTFSSKVQLAGTISAGKYFLAQLCIGNTGSTNGALLPTPDFTAPNTDTAASCVPAISATSGKLALVSNTTMLSGTGGTVAGLGGATCPTTNTAAIVDFVGFGTATCYEGTGPAPTLSASLAAIRDASNDNSGDNRADFSAVTPAPRNSATGSTTPVTTLAVTSATANPVNLTAGSNVTYSVTVTPATGVAVTGVQVDLSSVGGSASQALTLGATPNVYTFATTVPGGTAGNYYSLPVTVTDAASSTANAAISLNVQDVAGITAISVLQRNRAGFVGGSVTTRGIITLVAASGYYMQTASSTPGSTGDEGLYVYTGSSTKLASVVVGNDITVTGNLSLFPLATVSHTPSLELGSAAITLNGTGTVPAPIAIATGIPTATGGIYQLTQYEGMRVTFPSLTAVGPTDAFNDEANEAMTSTGQFYAVATGTPRPYREPGMDFRDFPSTTCPSLTNCTATVTSGGAARPANLVLYDDNPERLIVESSLGGGTNLDVSPYAVITNVTGVIDFSYATDVPYGDPARLILEPGTVSPTSANYTPSNMTITPLALPTAKQFTVAAFNVERFYDADPSNDIFYNAGDGHTETSSAVDMLGDAYTRRLKKVSLAIRTVLNNPDIISLEEVENVQVLKDIATQIDADTTTGTKPGYVAYGTDSTTTFTNDSSGISIGFLIKPSRVNFVSWEQIGTKDVVPTGTTLNDRPSQVLHATINRDAGTTPYPITVISNHLRSLNGIGTSDSTRLKKELQAEMLANLIETYQAKKEHVIAVGDMNAFQFSDGYTDTLGTITGNVGTGIAVQPGKSGILSTPAVDLINKLSPADQQTYTEWGSAQVLDHAIVTADIANSTSLVVGHIDADFPVVLHGDASTAAATSDHDPILAYLALPAAVPGAGVSGVPPFPATVVGVSSVGQVATLTNIGDTTLTVNSVSVTGDFAQSNNCGASLAPKATCSINVVFTPTATGNRTGNLTVSTTGTSAIGPITAMNVVSLSGMGTAAGTPAFMLDNGSGSNTLAITTPAGVNGTGTLTFTSTNGFSGTISLSCSGTGGTGMTCSVPSSVTVPAAGKATATVTITTTARTQASASGLGAMPRNGHVAYMVLVAMLMGAVFMMRKASRNVRVGGLLVLMLALAAGLSGCSSSSLNTSSNPSGTAAGAYSYTVTATSGGVSKTETIAVTVQ